MYENPADILEKVVFNIDHILNLSFLFTRAAVSLIGGYVFDLQGVNVERREIAFKDIITQGR